MRWPAVLSSSPRCEASSWEAALSSVSPLAAVGGSVAGEDRVPSGQTPSAFGHSRQEGLPHAPGSLCVFRSRPQQHPRAGVSERQRGAQAGLPRPGCLSCLPLVPVWESSAHFSSASGPFPPHPRVWGALLHFHSCKGGRGGCPRSAGELLGITVLTPASCLGRGPVNWLWWTLSLSLDPARGSPSRPGAELKAGDHPLGAWVSGA